MQRDDEDERERAESGRMRVRRLLIEPLARAGLRRRPRVSAEEHDAALRRVEERLAYLGEAELGVLAEIVERSAGGEARNLWPDEVSVRNWAAQLRPPPAEDSRLVVSWMGSAAGRRAWDEGEEVAVALCKHLRRIGRPPTDFDWTRIRREASGWAHRRVVVAERIEAGTAGEADLDWRNGLHRAIAEVRRLVFGTAGEGGSA